MFKWLHLVIVLVCAKMIALDLTLEEKVGQILMVHVHGEIANDDAKALIQDVKVGGIIYYNWANGLYSPYQVQNLSWSLQRLTQETPSRLPLLIAVDQEGGIVTRLNQGFTVFPSNRALCETHDPNMAHWAAYITGEELRAVGVNMNLAPVVDVNSNPRNPVIGIRSYGDNPEEVISFAEKALEGYQKANIIATLKHYPGHGDVEIDSHEALPLISKSIEELEKNELLPFRKLAPQANVIMTAHLRIPSMDQEKCATYSKKILDYLRNELGFNGAIITDSLAMKGALQEYPTIDEAVIAAINAGSDIILLGGSQLVGGQVTFEFKVDDIKRIHASVVDAVRKGVVSEERLDESVKRILDLKEHYLPKDFYDPPPAQISDNQQLAIEIARKSLCIEEKTPITMGEKVLIVCPNLLGPYFKGPITFEGLNPTKEEIEQIAKQAEIADTVLLFSYNAWKNPSQMQLIQTLFDRNNQLILCVMRDPLDGDLFPDIPLVIKAFNPTAVSIQAILDALQLS